MQLIVSNTGTGLSLQLLLSFTSVGIRSVNLYALCITWHILVLPINIFKLINAINILAPILDGWMLEERKEGRWESEKEGGRMNGRLGG